MEHGKYKLNVDSPKLKPVSDYLKLQGRFRHLSEDAINEIQQRVNEEYAKLKEQVSLKLGSIALAGKDCGV